MKCFRALLMLLLRHKDDATVTFYAIISAQSASLGLSTGVLVVFWGAMLGRFVPWLITRSNIAHVHVFRWRLHEEKIILTLRDWDPFGRAPIWETQIFFQNCGTTDIPEVVGAQSYDFHTGKGKSSTCADGVFPPYLYKDYWSSSSTNEGSPSVYCWYFETAVAFLSVACLVSFSWWMGC